MNKCQDLILKSKALSGVDTVQTYIQQVYQIPLLTPEEEQEYAIRLRDENDLEAARQLVMSHLRFVIKIAKGYQGYGLPLADLIQEGNVGLMKAVKRFDPEQGVRLVSFAVHWIKAEIHEYVIRNWRIVKIATTKAQRKLFFNLRSMKKRLNFLKPAEIQEISEELGVEPKDVIEMESRLAASDLSFDLPNQDEEDSSPHLSPVEYLAEENVDPAFMLEEADTRQNKLQTLRTALAKLDDRSRDILQQRWLAIKEKATLHELAAKYQVSAERIRQIEETALKKLKVSLLPVLT